MKHHIQISESDRESHRVYRNSVVKLLNKATNKVFSENIEHFLDEYKPQIIEYLRNTASKYWERFDNSILMSLEMMAALAYHGRDWDEIRDIIEYHKPTIIGLLVEMYNSEDYDSGDINLQIRQLGRYGIHWEELNIIADEPKLLAERDSDTYHAIAMQNKEKIQHIMMLDSSAFDVLNQFDFYNLKIADIQGASEFLEYRKYDIIEMLIEKVMSADIYHIYHAINLIHKYHNIGLTWEELEDIATEARRLIVAYEAEEETHSIDEADMQYSNLRRPEEIIKGKFEYSIESGVGAMRGYGFTIDELPQYASLLEKNKHDLLERLIWYIDNGQIPYCMFIVNDLRSIGIEWDELDEIAAAAAAQTSDFF